MKVLISPERTCYCPKRPKEATRRRCRSLVESHMCLLWIFVASLDYIFAALLIWTNRIWGRCVHSQVEWPLPTHLDLYQIVKPSSRRRKWRFFFQERDLTFLRIDPAIITLTCGSSSTPAQGSRYTGAAPSQLEWISIVEWVILYSREASGSISTLDACQWKYVSKENQMSVGASRFFSLNPS